MERMKKALSMRPEGEGILSLSLATFGLRGYSEFAERLDMMVESGMSQLLLISYNSDIFRLAEIAPAEQHMVNLGIAHGMYAEMFADNVAFARERYPELPIIVTPTIGDVLSFGMENFMRTCVKAGVDGMDTAQYPAIADPVGFRKSCEDAGIGFICAAAGGSIDLKNQQAVETMDRLTQVSSGEIFFVPSAPGTQRDLKGETFKPYIDRIHTVQEKSGKRCPVVCIGGISTAEQAHELVHIAGADGVHFSSAFMKRIFAGESLEKISAWLSKAKEAMA